MNLALILLIFNILGNIHFFSFFKSPSLKREQSSDLTGAFMCTWVFAFF